MMSDTGSLPLPGQQSMEDQLQPGEQIRWASRPGPLRLLTRQQGSILLGLFCIAIGLFLASGAASKLSAVVDPGAWTVFIGGALALYGLYDVGLVAATWLKERELPSQALRKGGWGIVLGVVGGALALGLLDAYLVQPGPEEGGTDLTLVIGLLAIAAGLYLLGSLYPVWARARRTAYAITDRRVIVQEGDRIISLAPETLGRVEVRERRDGSGDLLFHGARVALSSIPDVRLAAERVQALVEAPPSEGAPPEVAQRRHPFFYAVEPRKTAGDRFYKVYLAGGALCAARLGGQFSYGQLDEMVGQAGAFGVLLLPLLQWAAHNREKAEDRYDAMDPTSASFLAVDRHNFRISGETIDCIILRGRRDKHTGSILNSGTLTIHMRDGSTRRLILIGNQELHSLADLLNWVVEKVEITDLDAGPYAAAYEQLVAEARADPERVDWRALRTAYARSPQYDPFLVKGDAGPAYQALRQAIDSADARRIVEAGEEALQANYMHLGGHLQLSFRYGELGEEQRAAHHKAVARQWLDSLHSSGDGQSPGSAFRVVCPVEEETLLQVLHLEEVERQSGNIAGHVFDVLKVRPAGSEQTSELFYDVTAITRGLQEGRAVLPRRPG